MGINWHDELVSRLTEHFKDGWSASQSSAKLSEEFGIDITRNMVIAKRHRMGMNTDPTTTRINVRRAAKEAAVRYGRRRAVDPKDDAPKKPPTNFTATSSKTGLFVSGVSLPKEPLPKEESPSDYAKLYTMAELEAHQCKWYVGDPREAGTGFCGEKRAGSLPYCTKHAIRAYRAPEPRIRRPVVERIPTYLDLEKV